MKNNTPFILFSVKATQVNLSPVYQKQVKDVDSNYCISHKRIQRPKCLKTVVSLAQKGESANTRRLGFVCYKHAFIRFLNRFTWKRIQVLRRKHATLWVRKTFPSSCLLNHCSFIHQKQAGRFRVRQDSPVPKRSSPIEVCPELQKSLYGFVLLCVRCYCNLWLLVKVLQNERKRLKTAGERSNKEKEAHRDRFRGQRSWGHTGGRVWWRLKKR